MWAMGWAAALGWATWIPPLIEVTALVPGVRVDMPYAGSDNLAGEPLYPEARCLLRPEVAQMVARAQAHLQRMRPDLTLMLKDCYRPLSAQQRLFAAVAGTTRQIYIANPNRRHGSVHTYGAAVDVTLYSLTHQRESDLGTPFDHLGPRAEPRREAAMLACGRLRPEHVRRRRILRAALVEGGGFLPISREWWHFDALRGAALRRRWQVMDLPVSWRPPSAAPDATTAPPAAPATAGRWPSPPGETAARD